MTSIAARQPSSTLPLMQADPLRVQRTPADLPSWEAVRAANQRLLKQQRGLFATTYERARRDIDAATLLLRINEGFSCAQHDAQAKIVALAAVRSLCEEYPACRRAWNELVGQHNSEAFWSGVTQPQSAQLMSPAKLRQSGAPRH